MTSTPKIVREPMKTYRQHQRRVNALLIHPALLHTGVSLGNDGKALGWDWAQGEVKWTREYKDALWTGSFSKQGDIFAISTRGGVQIINPLDGQLIRDLLPTRGAMSLAISDDRRLVAGLIPVSVTTSWPSTPYLSVWQSETGKILFEVPLGDLFGTVASVAFSPDHRFVHVATSRSIFIIDIIQQRLLRNIPYSPTDDQMLINISYAQPLPWAAGLGISKGCSVLSLISMESGKSIEILRTRQSIDRVQFARNKSHLLIFAEGVVYVYDLSARVVVEVIALGEVQTSESNLPYRVPNHKTLSVFDNVRIDWENRFLFKPGDESGSILIWKL